MSYPVMPLGFLGSQGDNDTYRIERSLRFNSADSAYLSRTPASAGNRKTWTWSGWVKRGSVGTDQALFDASALSPNDQTFVLLNSNNKINFRSIDNGSVLYSVITTQVFRDMSAWYHIVFAVDTTQSTASDRVKIYVNGSTVTAFDTTTYPVQNYDTHVNRTYSHAMGRSAASAGFYLFDGYLTEINFIDGQALTPSSFGETDAITGRWKAKAYSGTYGTNGFYLKFADNSGTTATTLGKDSSGNGNNWTPNNFSVTAGAGNDSLVDSPTNYGTDTGVGGEVRGNYATLNPLDIGPTSALANGNLDFSTSSGPNYSICRSTIGVPSGKWYWEILVNSSATANMVGVANSSATLSQYLGQNASGWGYYSDGQKYNNGSGSAYGASFTTNDVIGVALDMDAGTLVFYKNNSSQGTAFSGLSGTLFPTVSDASSASSANLICNFGQRPFAYTAPSGFKALCTTNLPTQIIQKPSKYMDVVTYTGNNSARSITGLNFSPDLVWIKVRSRISSHVVIDSVRGVTRALDTSSTSSDTAYSFTQMSSINSDGFSLTANSLSDPYYVNTNSDTFVAWAWDAGESSSTNTAGSITSTVRVNAQAGCSIVSFTAPNSASPQTVGHGLGVAPRFIITKSRGASGNWNTYHASLGATQYLFLNTTDAAVASSTRWNNTTPTSSVFTLGSNFVPDASLTTYIAYCFAEVEGFSKFGSYTGNGSSDGPLLWCGFSPKWVLIKRSNGISEWHIFDSARDIGNETDLGLYANGSNAEASLSTNKLGDFLSNGIKLRGTASDTNGNAVPYIFAAFAESPFKYARAR